MLELSLLREADAQDVLHFEMENRRYFATYISDRGDDYFAHFPRYFAEDMAEQERGAYRLYLARQASGELIGRVNLRDIRLQNNRRTASLGYRIGERFSGQGCATQAVALVCRTAQYELHLHQITAMTTVQNVGSQRVLVKSGFEVTEGSPTNLNVNGRSLQTIHYRRILPAT